jgi:3-hydroxyacyl-[acyl-carrier-protein] dehydratase
MHFTFVDRVLELQPGVKITTVKCLSLAEEYLADHFPRFPVMPGVLMLQAMTEASAWLIQATEDFAHSIVTLKDARNVRFADFVQPGWVLTVTAEMVRVGPREVQFKTQGTLSGRVAVVGRLVLERYNLADSKPDLAPTDAYLKRHLKAQLALVYRPPVETTAAASSALVAPANPTPEPSRGKV